MARAIRSSTLETRSARLRLPVSVKPTFVRVAKGLGLGYRRNKSGGVWVMRVADGKRSSWVRTIGAADDFAEADGDDVLNFWQAQDQRQTQAAGHLGRAGSGLHDSAATDPHPVPPNGSYEKLTSAKACCHFLCRYPCMPGDRHELPAG